MPKPVREDLKKVSWISDAQRNIRAVSLTDLLADMQQVADFKPNGGNKAFNECTKVYERISNAEALIVGLNTALASEESLENLPAPIEVKTKIYVPWLEAEEEEDNMMAMIESQPLSRRALKDWKRANAHETEIFNL